MESIIVWNHHANIIRVYFIILKLRKLDLKLTNQYIFRSITKYISKTFLFVPICTDIK